MIRTYQIHVFAESQEHTSKYRYRPCHIQQKRGLESQMDGPCKPLESLDENESTCHDSRDCIFQFFHLCCALDQIQIHLHQRWCEAQRVDPPSNMKIKMLDWKPGSMRQIQKTDMKRSYRVGKSAEGKKLTTAVLLNLSKRLWPY